jgi:cysteine synthase
MLRLVGVQPEFTRGSPDEPSGIQKAREAGAKLGFFSPSQYENYDNPEAFAKWLAPQIWDQTGGKLTVFAAGLGTTGTVLGSSQFFRTCPRKIEIVGARCAPDQAVPGVRSEVKLREISLDWKPGVDTVIDIMARESYKRSLDLCRSGIVCGPSSGFAVAGLLHFLESRSADLDQLRNQDDEVIAAFVCADTPLPYLDKYSTYLDSSDF